MLTGMLVFPGLLMGIAYVRVCLRMFKGFSLRSKKGKNIYLSFSNLKQNKFKSRIRFLISRLVIFISRSSACLHMSYHSVEVSLESMTSYYDNFV